jgi:hypothetical protein
MVIDVPSLIRLVIFSSADPPFLKDDPRILENPNILAVLATISPSSLGLVRIVDLPENL